MQVWLESGKKSRTIREDLSMFYCNWRNKIAIRGLFSSEYGYWGKDEV